MTNDTEAQSTRARYFVEIGRTTREVDAELYEILQAGPELRKWTLPAPLAPTRARERKKQMSPQVMAHLLRESAGDLREDGYVMVPSLMENAADMLAPLQGAPQERIDWNALPYIDWLRTLADRLDTRRRDAAFARDLADQLAALVNGEAPLQGEREPAKALSDGINLADVLVWLQNRPGGSWKATISDIGKAVSGIKADRTERALHPQEVPDA